MFVTVTYPPLWTIPHPDPPTGPGGFLKHDLPQKVAQPWTGPRDLQPGHPGHPGSFWSLCGKAEAIQPGPSPQNHLGPWSCLWPPFLPLLLLGPPQTPESHHPRKASEEVQLLLSGTKVGSPVLRSQVGTPFSPLPGHGSPKGCLSPHPESPSSSSTSSLQPVCPVRSQVQGVGGQGPFSPNTHTHTRAGRLGTKELNRHFSIEITQMANKHTGKDIHH